MADKPYPELDDKIREFKLKYGEYRPTHTVEDVIDDWLSTTNARCLTIVGKEEGGTILAEEAQPVIAQRAMAAYRKCMIDATKGALEHVREKASKWADDPEFQKMKAILDKEPPEQRIKTKRAGLMSILGFHARGREGSRAHTERTRRIMRDIHELEELEGHPYMP